MLPDIVFYESAIGKAKYKILWAREWLFGC